MLICSAAVGRADDTESTAEEEPTYYVSEFTDIVQDWKLEEETDLDPRIDQGMVIWEVTRYPDQLEPTPEQQMAMNDLRERAFAAVRKNGWQDFGKMAEEGWELLFSDDVHYFKREHITDDRVLDPEHPEFLIYYDTDSGKRLAGIMFVVTTGDQRGPQIGGPKTLWHYHVWNRLVCLWEGRLIVSMADDEGECADDEEPADKSLEMLHLWLFDHPLGAFATSMDLQPFQIKQLEKTDW